MAAVTIFSDFGAPKNKVWHCFHCFPIYFPWSDRTGCHDLHFLNLRFKPTFSLSTFTFIKRLFSSSVFQKLLIIMSIEQVIPSNYLIFCHPLLLLPLTFHSIRVFSNKLALHIRWLSIRASALASILPVNIQDWFPLGLTGLSIILSKGLSRVFSNTTVQKHQVFGAQASLWSNSHIRAWLLEKL